MNDSDHGPEIMLGLTLGLMLAAGDEDDESSD
jgi:hypothetical protein